jgi:hypothetical protein
MSELFDGGCLHTRMKFSADGARCEDCGAELSAEDLRRIGFEVFHQQESEARRHSHDVPPALSDKEEFDDVVRNGPYVSSAKAREEMARIAREHGLAFTHDAGGGQFFGNGIACRISTFDDVDDLNLLRRAIMKSAEPSITIEVTGPPIPQWLAGMFPGATGVALIDDRIEVTRTVDGRTVDEVWRIEKLETGAEMNLTVRFVQRTERT